MRRRVLAQMVLVETLVFFGEIKYQMLYWEYQKCFVWL